MAESSSPVDAALPSRTAELGTLVRLALPAVATQLAQMGMGVLDTVMAGRVSAEDLAGVALGGNIIWPTMLLLMGVLMALTPNIAQLRGEGRRVGRCPRGVRAEEEGEDGRRGARVRGVREAHVRVRE